jgi:hypothetical protein
MYIGFLFAIIVTVISYALYAVASSVESLNFITTYLGASFGCLYGLCGLLV